MEIEILMFSAEVSVTCRREFAGADADPRFIDLMPTPAVWAGLLRRLRRGGSLMARQSFIWTALPNGYTADGAACACRCMLSPRLDPQDPLGQPHKNCATFFPDWQDWPATLANARFDVALQRAKRIGAGHDDDRCRIASTPGSGSRIRPSGRRCSKAISTSRDSRTRTLSDKDMLSYDTGVMQTLIEQLYRDLARSAARSLAARDGDHRSGTLARADRRGRPNR